MTIFIPILKVVGRPCTRVSKKFNNIEVTTRVKGSLEAILGVIF